MTRAFVAGAISGSRIIGTTSLGELLIDVQRLAVLREVARAGSFAGAAVALHHTPSAVSQQIAALERSAGIVLVDRSTRGVTLTDAGRLLVGAANTIHSELQTATQQLHELRDHGPPALTVVSFPSAGEPLLAPALTALTGQMRTHVDITVIEAEPDEALTAIRDGEADIALLYHFHVPEPPRHWSSTAGPGRYLSLAAERFRLVVPVAHPVADRPSVDLAELADDRWIQGWGDPGAVLDTLAAGRGFRPHVACRSSDYRFITALIGAGVGIALIPELALARGPAVRDLAINPEPTRYVGAYIPRRQWRNRTAERLLAALRDRAQAIERRPSGAQGHAIERPTGVDRHGGPTPPG